MSELYSEAAMERPAALFEIRDVLEGMSSIQLMAYKNRMLSEMSDREILVHQINDVLEANGNQFL